MINFRSIKKEALRKPCFIDHDSFILCRPGRNYKINAAICIIKAENPILYDVGIGREMLSLVKSALSSFNKTPKDVGFALISHIHFDHCLNLAIFNRTFPNCKVIFHENAFNNITRRVKQFPTKYDKKQSLYFTNFWKLFVQASYLRKGKVYVCKDNDIIPCRDVKLKVIHTPGHSSGHACLLDCTNKTLFLGDHLPFTPWLDITPDAIDDMLYSLRKLISLSSKEVKYSVRNHGNLKDDWKEVYEWEEEKERFKDFLELILSSIDRITSILKNNPLTIEELARKILKNKNYRDYNLMMNLFFMPPNLSWIICYLLKLKKEGKVIDIKKGNKWVAT